MIFNVNFEFGEIFFGGETIRLFFFKFKNFFLSWRWTQKNKIRYKKKKLEKDLETFEKGNKLIMKGRSAYKYQMLNMIK